MEDNAFEKTVPKNDTFIYIYIFFFVCLIALDQSSTISRLSIYVTHNVIYLKIQKFIIIKEKYSFKNSQSYHNFYYIFSKVHFWNKIKTKISYEILNSLLISVTI